MRILLVFYSLSSGGVSNSNLTLANEFIKRGIEVDVLTYVESASSKKWNDDVNYYSFGFRKFGLLELFKSFFKSFSLFKRFGYYDLVISSSELTSFPIAIARYFFKFDLIVNSHTDLIEHLKSKNLLHKSLYFVCSLFIKNNAKLANVSYGAVFSSKKFYKTQRVTFLPNPVVPWDFKSNKYDIHPWFASFRVIVACGRLTKSKNYDLMLLSFRELLKKIDDVRLIIIGDGEDRSRIEKLILQHSLSEFVCLVGDVPEPRVYMQHAIFLYHTSLYEGAGMVLVESLSTGVPVVTTRFKSGADEILENGKYGLLIDSFCVDSCVTALTEALSVERHDRNHFLIKANEFSPENCADKYLRLFNEK